MIENALLKIGQSIAKQLAVKWLAEKKTDARRGLELTQLIGRRFPSRRSQRDVLDALVKIEDEVADRLAPILTNLAFGLDDNERDAALCGVSDALENADLSNESLFAIDMNARRLVETVRKKSPATLLGLSERAERLHEIALNQACSTLISLVRELPEFDAAAAVETLSRLREVIAGLDLITERIPVRRLSSPSGMNFDDEFLRRYLAGVAKSYGQLEVIGLTTHSYEPRTTLSVAYLSLTVTDDAKNSSRTEESRYAADWGRNNRDIPVPENVRVEAALAGNRLIVIRGEAGAGKSTLLRWLAVNAAQQKFVDKLEDWNGCVPFLVKLRDFSERSLPRGDELLSQPTSPQCGPVPAEWVHRRFESGNALLLVDGVDELLMQRRNAVRHWLRDLLYGYPELRIVVTSRPTAVNSRWLVNDGFSSVVLEPMNSSDVAVFMRRWHAALLDSTQDPALLPCRPEEVIEHQRALLAQLQSRPNLRALARSPLLCAMLCALNLDRRAKLPRDRLALYSAALDMLLERRDADRNVAAAEEVEASANEKLVLLRVLAWWLNENGRTEMSREQALARMSDCLRGMPNVREDAGQLLEHLIERSGVIRQPVQGRVDFIHRTFQEFLAAREAVDRDSVELLVGHARSDSWRETILMACAQGSSEQRGRLLSGMLDLASKSGPRTARQLNLLVAACKETAVLAPREVLSRVESCIIGLVPPRSVRESRSLATVGEPILDYVPLDSMKLSSAQAAACVRTVTLVNGPRSLKVLKNYVNDPRSKVQEELVRGWKYFDAEAYVDEILQDAPLPSGDWDRVDIDFREAIPLLCRIRNLRRCRVNLWHNGPVSKELQIVGELQQLTDLIVLADAAPETLPALGKLTNLKTIFLNFLNDWPSSLPFLGNLDRLTQVWLTNATGVRDFSFLGGLERLEGVHLISSVTNDWIGYIRNPGEVNSVSCGYIDDRRTLRSFAQRFPNLHELSLHDSSSLMDISRLSSLPLYFLSFYDCPTIDLSGISGHPTLRHLRIAGSAGQIQVDLSPLANESFSITLAGSAWPLGLDTLGKGVKVHLPRRRNF